MSILRRIAAPLALLSSSFVPCALAAEAEPAPPAEPAIEIVRDGGVAATWRDEGGAFATYGPDGEAVTPTFEAQALRALAAAHDIRFVSLQPTGQRGYPGDDAAHPRLLCDAATECLEDNAVVGRVPVDSAAQAALARDLLAGWLRDTGGPWSACMPQYHHALQFSADGHAWDVLLCYGCGHYLIRRDGIEVARAESADKAGIAGFNALLREAGIAYWDPETMRWADQ